MDPNRTARRVLALPAVVAVAVAIIGAAPASAPPAPRTVVVAPRGSDDASGTTAHPLASVEAALARVQRTGGRVLLRTGTYHQRVVVRGAHDVSIESYPHEHAVLSGAGLTPPTGRSAMVDIANSRSITIRGLEITAYSTSAIDAMPIGVYIHGSGSRIRITQDHVTSGTTTRPSEASG